MRLSTPFCCALFCLFFLTVLDVQAQLSPGQTRKLITRMGSFELPSGAVRVKSLALSSASSAEATADIETAYRLEKNEHGNWRVVEIRTAPDRWERIEDVAKAVEAGVTTSDCDKSELLREAADPSVKRVRCLLAQLVRVKLPSDAVRVKSVSALGVPLTSRPSAMAVVVVRVDVRLVGERKTGWRVAEIRAGQSEWRNLDQIATALNVEKTRTARKELEMIAKGLEAFRADRGFYIASDKESVVIDQLNPLYLSRVIRLDPWHSPYQYQGERDHFTIRSVGPDGKENTADDIVVQSSSR